MDDTITDEMINRTLAEYMGVDTSKDHTANSWCKHCDEYPVEFTESLDACIPVVEKIYKEDIYEPTEFKIHSILSDGWKVETILGHHDGDITIKQIMDKSPSRALALACYHVIKELK